MTRRALLGLLLVAACSGRDQIVIELNGPVTGATRVDVTLLEPVVLAKKQRRNERNGMAAGDPELVYYVAQRGVVGFELGGEPIDGLQFEVKDSGGPYVPLVAVRNEQGVLALGIYNPDSVFGAAKPGEYEPDAVRPVSDVSIYPIRLEPAKGFEANADQPTGVLKGEVMVVRCGPGGRVSGAVWRRGDDKQLRLLLPLAAEEPSAVARLDAPDLDCDQHSPAPVGLEARGAGDELDCDDTSFIVHAKAAERCSVTDEDCNPETTTSTVFGPAAGCQCQTTGNLCTCEDPGTVKCPDPMSFKTCAVPSKSAGTVHTPCDSRGELEPLPDCANGCIVTLTAAPPGWDVRIGADRGIGEPVTVPAPGRPPIVVRATNVSSTPSPAIVLNVKGPNQLSTVVVKLVLVGETCGPTNPIQCPAP